MGKKERFISLLNQVEDKGIERLIDYLENKTDFFIAPASTCYHGNYEGGLLEHSLNVYDRLKSNIENSDIYNNVPKRTIIITTLLHDLCKINFYSNIKRWRKDKHQQWEQYDTYGIDDELPYGHGEKSVFIITKFITLSTYESMMIRWHMGLSEPKENYKYLSKALEKFPLILALMNADMESTYILEKN